MTSAADTLQFTYDSMQRLTCVTQPDGTTVDYVYDALGNRLMKTTTLPGAPSNQPPAAVTNPSIANGVTNVPTTATLSWSPAVDPNSGDSVVYFIYFGTSPNPPLVFSGWATNWSPDKLRGLTTYYWQVVARDSHNAQQGGPVWKFTTVHDSPLVDFSATPTKGWAPLSVVFTDRSVMSDGAILSSWEWDFNNDGIIDSTLRNPTNTFTSTGVYPVALRVRDSLGSVATLVKSNLVAVMGNDIFDLAPISLSVASALSYRHLEVRYGITNRGTQSVTGTWQWEDAFYVGTNSTIDASSRLALSFQENQSLPAGASYWRTNLVYVPQGVDESYNLLLEADGSNVLAEISEANNTLSVSLRGRLPDLAPGPLAASTTVTISQPMQIVYSVTNRGLLPLAAEWHDRLYLSSNAVLDAQAAVVASFPVNKTLAPGQGYRSTNTVTVPRWNQGSAYLILKADDDDTIVEANETNNSTSLPITVAIPDLVPGLLIVPSPIASGASIQVVYSVTNQGPGVVSGQVCDTLLITTNTVLDSSAYEAGTWCHTLSLSGGSGAIFTNTAHLPDWPAGPYRLFLKVDADDNVGETSETNNISSGTPIVLSVPDLQPIGLQVVGVDGSGLTNLAAASGVLPQSAHPCASSHLQSWTNRVPGAEVMLVTFDPRCSGEDYSAWLDIMDAQSNNIAGSPFQLDDLAGQTKLVPGDTLRLRLTSYASTGWGFAVTQIRGGKFDGGPITVTSLSNPVVFVLWTVTNHTGITPSGSWYDSIAYSANATLESTDPEWTTYFRDTSAPSPGKTRYTGEAQLTLPATPSGNCWLFVTTDQYDWLTEANESNNVYGVAVRLVQAGSPLPAPTLSSPCGTTVGMFIPVLSWSDVSGEGGYELQVCAGTNPPVGLLQALTLASNTTAYAVPAGVLEAASTYSWRVRALGSGINWGDSAWSEACVFATGGAYLPVPVATSPACRSIITTLTPTLTWSNLAGGNVFRLELYSDMSLPWGLLVATQLMANVTSWKVPAGLLWSSQLYSWRVQAVGNQTNTSDSPWSDLCPFITSCISQPPTNQSPSIADQPQDQTALAGTTAQFAVTAYGSEPIFYRWRKDGVALAGSSRVTGLTNDVLTIANLVSNDAGGYTVVVSNPAGSVTSTVATLIVRVPPTVSVQPQSKTVVMGNTATFTVTAGGDAPFSYLWLKNGADLTAGERIGGVNTSTLSILNVTTNDAGGYSVIVSNLGGVTTSASATLTVVQETNKPTLTMLSPTSGQRWSNAVLTVKGTASDNVQVAVVFYQLNSSAWEMAASTDGWTNWSATKDLLPGTNTVRAYAVDSSGNRSLTNSVNFVYVVTSRLLVKATGQGILSPNYSNAVLEIGQGYIMTASGANGHKFSQWQVTTNWAMPAVVVLTNKLDFIMQSNLTLTVVFLDTNRPTVTVTNLVANQRLSNTVFTVNGTASDNVGVSNVWYRLNGGAWALAQGTNLWAASLQLDQRSNTFQVFAEDAVLNRSTTNAVTFLRVFTSLMGVQINGQGTVTSNYNGKWLEIGNVYSMTASAGTGYAFSNWTDGGAGVVTNKATVSFLMWSNLVLQANFVDVQKPVLTITSPANGARFSNAVATVRGTVSDNGPMGVLWHQYAGGNWVGTPANSNWSVGLMLASGTNLFRIYAVDAAGNISLTNSRSLVCTLPASALTNIFKITAFGRTNAGWRLLVSDGMWGANRVVQGSSNLVDWTAVFTNLSTNALIEFLDPQGTNASRRFYRVMLP